MQKDRLYISLEDTLAVVLIELRLALDDGLITLNRYYFTRIFIYEIFRPRFHYITCKRATDAFLKIRFVNFNLFCQIEAIEDILIAFESDGAKQSGYRQLLLTINVSIHYLIDVRSELNP